MPELILILLIPLMPLAAFLILGLANSSFVKRWAGTIGTSAMLVSASAAILTAYDYFFVFGGSGGVYRKIIVAEYEWLQFTPEISIKMGLLLDPVSVMMLVVISFISLMVHSYSICYMKGEQRFNIYFSYLALFTFSMLALVMSSNIFQMYIFWELVGVSSFLLIGFYYQKPSAVAAAKKAFIITRFADLGLLIGILILAFEAKSLDFEAIIGQFGHGKTASALNAAAWLGIPAISWATLLIFIGGAGKSAMFPLHVWLPDAMEGPTPVSALIHAATMVVAGVFLVARLFPVYYFSAPEILHLIAYVGVFSALIAAIIACTQTDIKRVLAYSTMSQIGFMMFSLGVSGFAEEGLGFTGSQFHLFTHAFFKALLFLCAGLVIHEVHSNEVSKMGGLRKSMPLTHICFLIACLAIAGIPPFAGFFSKEEILLAAWERNKPVYWIALFTSALTAFYMFRLYFLVFRNKDTHLHKPEHREGSAGQMVPLFVLAAGSVALGLIPFGSFVSSDGRPLSTELHLVFSIAPVLLAVAGILTAAWLYNSTGNRPEEISRRLGNLYKAAYHKFYIDEVWLFITKKLIMNGIGKPAAWFDKHVINALVNFSGNSTIGVAGRIKKLQSGKVQLYGMVYLFTVIASVLIIIYFLNRN